MPRQRWRYRNLAINLKLLPITSLGRPERLLKWPAARPPSGAVSELDRHQKIKRNTAPMLSSLRCGAKTRTGKPCQSPAVNGKKRCRMHGGAEGSGAPKGNQNALKHGQYTKREIEERLELRKLIREANKYMEEF